MSRDERPDGPRAADLESTFRLIERARSGDREALELLFARHLTPLQRWACGRLPRWARDLADTDDVVQDTLVQTLRRIEHFEPRRVGALQAYLRRAVINRIRNELRRQGRAPQATVLDGLEVEGVESPLEEAIGREAVERYEAALARLAALDREAIIARVETGCSFDELARALGKPTPEAARKATERALVRLAREMDRPVALHHGTPSLSIVPRSAQSRPESMAAEGPALWGHLRLLEPIGRGASGRVYRAWDTRLDREVALKLLPAGPPCSDGGVSAITHEGRLLARVRHPNVATIYGAQHIGDHVGLWMEFVRGQTLEQILAERQVLSASEAIDVGLELCEAISAVHGAGLLHRDIKPHNVMRADDGRIVLMDLGTGREVDDDVSPDLVGTPLYLAPEVLAGQHATMGSDIYSLGVLLYRLVTSSFPVRARSVRGLRRAHQRGWRTAVRDARPGVPAALARVIERAIDPSPERRYGSAGALGADLAALKPRPRSAGLRRGSSEPDACEVYLHACSLVDRRGLANVQKAADLFEQAVVADPGFAPAHAGLANAHAFMSFPYRGIPYAKAYPIMRAAALKGVALDPHHAEAHAAMGWVYAYGHEWANAERAFRQAIRLNPRHTRSYTSFSISTLQPLRKFDEALRLLHEAARHDPSSLDVQREIGEVLLYSGRYAEAVETFHRITDVEPDFPFAQAYLGKALAFAGRPEEAIPRLELEPGSPWLAHAYVLTGARDEACELAEESAAHPYRLAVIAGALGDARRAVDALERAAASEPHRVGRLLIEPELSALGDSRGVAVIRQAFGLPR